MTISSSQKFVIQMPWYMQANKNNIYLIEQIWYRCCMFAMMNNTDQFIHSLISLSNQFAYLYVAGIVFFFYLRSRRMRNIYKDIKNYTKHRLIDRKIKLKGVLMLIILIYWVLVVYYPIKFTDSTTNFALGANVALSSMLNFVIFILGSQTGLWLSDDEDFSNSNWPYDKKYNPNVSTVEMVFIQSAKRDCP